MQTGSTGLHMNAQNVIWTMNVTMNVESNTTGAIKHSVHEIVDEADDFISFVNCSQSDNVPPCQKAKITHPVKLSDLNVNITVT